ncbi:hypothetical protein GYB29_09570 [bacterium]|nr:hypothetical protein [bacterium]
MKLNKNVLTLATFAIFLLASCTQARYGHMTRRVKTTKDHTPERVAKQEKQQTQKEKDKAVVPFMADPAVIADAAPAENAPEKVETAERVKPSTTVAVTNQVDHDRLAKLENTTEKVSSIAQRFGNPATRFIAKKASQKYEKQLKSGKDDDGGLFALLRIILIILLILIIVDLILGLFAPWLRGVVGTIILILLILWLINYLS